MKKCKVYSTERNQEAEGIIFDERVLLPAPRRGDMEPAYIEDGVCYYPPSIAASFAKSMPCDRMPFSTECEWGEFGDEEDEGYPKPYWAQEYYGDDDIEEKWGYCYTTTGRIIIAPQWASCKDFKYDYAVVGASIWYGAIDEHGNEVIPIEYDKIEQPHEGLFLTRKYGEWGAIGDYGMPDTFHQWRKIWWDGWGGVTVMSWNTDHGDLYHILNGDKKVACELTALPERYTISSEEMRPSSYWDSYEFESFRITKRGEKYGLVRDFVVPQMDRKTYSELVLEPEHSYDDVLKAARERAMTGEVEYYFNLMIRRPKHLPNSSKDCSDGWNDVPEDIRNAVRKLMSERGIKQPETIDEVEY